MGDIVIRSIEDRINCLEQKSVLLSEKIVNSESNSKHWWKDMESEVKEMKEQMKKLPDEIISRMQEIIILMIENKIQHLENKITEKNNTTLRWIIGLGISAILSLIGTIFSLARP